MASTSLYLEKKVAEKIGIPRAMIRETILKKNKGWEMAGRDVVLTDAGLAKVLEEVRVVTGAEMPADFTDCLHAHEAQKKNGGAGAAAAAGDGAVPLEVTRIFRDWARGIGNPQIIEAALPSGERVRVRVKSSENLLPKMKLQARQDAAGGWHMEGRCPRYRGRY